MCLQVAASGTPAAHLTFWLGSVVGHFVPSLTAGSHAPRPPAGLVQAAEVLLELFSHGTVPPDGLATARAAAIYCTGCSWTPPSPQGRGQVALGLELGLEKAVGLCAASGHGGQDVPAPSQCAAYDWLFWFSFITYFINPDIIPFCIFKIGA